MMLHSYIILWMLIGLFFVMGLRLGAAQSSVTESKDDIFFTMDNLPVIELNPDFAAAYRFRGISYLFRDDYAHALIDFTIAIALDPNNVNAYATRRKVYKAKKDYARAIADYTEVLRLKPDDANAYYSRGRIYYFRDFEKGDYVRAIADFTKTIELAPDFANAYMFRSLIYSKIGYDARANVDAAKAKELRLGKKQ